MQKNKNCGIMKDRPRLFFCASSPVSKKAIEWPTSGTKIKKLRNGESPLPRPPSHRMDYPSGAMEDTSCPRPLGHRTEKSSGAERDTSCPRWNTLRVRRGGTRSACAGPDKQQIIDQTKHDLHEGRSRCREPDLEQRNACHPADRIGDRNPHAE